MRRIVCCVAIVALTALPAVAAAAGWTVSLQGGASVPTGDFADENKANAETGWAVGGAVDYMWNDMWAFGVDGAWNQNTSAREGESFSIGSTTATFDEDKFKIWQLGAHAKYFFPTGASMPVKWYGLVGAGIYGFKEEGTIVPTSGSSSDFEVEDKRGGARLGLGGLWWANPQVGIHGGVDYNVAFLDKDDSDSSSLMYAGVHAGVTFKIPTAGE